MLLRYRRFWCVLTLVMVCIPMFSGLLTDLPAKIRAEEFREPAPLPDLPRNIAQLRAFFPALDAWLRDHFGLRHWLIHLQSTLVHDWLQSSSDKVLIGRDGWLFFRGDQMLQQSAGLLVRTDRVAETAQTIVQIRDALAARGIGFLFAPPPSSSTIYPDELPEWARNPGRQTEYGLLVRQLAARGVQTVDLRPALLAERSAGPIYRAHDTHWTPRGALAAYNATALAAGHGEWRLMPSTELSGSVDVFGGDLARLLGIDSNVAESVEPFSRAPGPEERFGESQEKATMFRAGSADPTILVIGDSFTLEFFAPLFAAHAVGFAWTHHNNCVFDWKWIDRFRPIQIWWMPNERAILCGPGGQPIGMPH
jgi:alginate O-acetyltransferase complex protein AlgJ